MDYGGSRAACAASEACITHVELTHELLCPSSRKNACQSACQCPCRSVQMQGSSFLPGGVGVEKVLFSPTTNDHGPVMASARQRLIRLPLISRPQATYSVPFGCCQGAGLSQLSCGKEPELLSGSHGPATDLDTWILEPCGLLGLHTSSATS